MSKAWITQKNFTDQVRQVVRQIDPNDADRMDATRWESARKAFDRAAQLMQEIEADLGLAPGAGWALKAKNNAGAPASPAAQYIEDLGRLLQQGRQPAQGGGGERAIEKSLQASRADPFTRSAADYVSDLFTKGVVLD